MEFTSEQAILQSLRATGNTHGIRNVQEFSKRSHRRDFERQLNSWGVRPQQRGSCSRTFRNRHGDLGPSGGHPVQNSMHTYSGSAQLYSRPSIENSRHSQLDFTPRSIPIVREKIRSFFNRQIRHEPELPIAAIQFKVLGTEFRRGKCSSTRLEFRKQLCQPPMGPHPKSSTESGGGSGRMHAYRPHIPSSAMVSDPSNPESLRTNYSSCSQKRPILHWPKPGANEEQSMAASCVEDLWKRSLKSEGWSDRATNQFQFCLAKSTRSSYNTLLFKCNTFCTDINESFPPKSLAISADFLCLMADSSQRPKSILCTALSALSLVYVHSGLCDITKNPSIVRLCSALIKSGTSAPLRHSTVLPIQAFHNLFKTWESNDKLSLADLRLKAITLLALSLMLRPSDIAPKGEVFNSFSGETSNFLFTTDMLKFTNDGLLITLMAIKNDSNRDGFEVFLPSIQESKLDPVQTLKDYLRRTEPFRSDGAVFISLKRPYSAISASSVAKVLECSISKAGLSGQGFSAKSFRPTGATRAIDAGIDPNIVQKMGRWKCTEVFRNHYVHSKTPVEYTSSIIG